MLVPEDVVLRWTVDCLEGFHQFPTSRYIQQCLESGIKAFNYYEILEEKYYVAVVILETPIKIIIMAKLTRIYGTLFDLISN